MVDSPRPKSERLCRSPCGKPLAFRSQISLLRLRLGGIAARFFEPSIGKPEAFRKESGRAANGRWSSERQSRQ
jgi:hypothetical protein